MDIREHRQDRPDPGRDGGVGQLRRVLQVVDRAHRQRRRRLLQLGADPFDDLRDGAGDALATQCECVKPNAHRSTPQAGVREDLEPIRA